MGLYLPGADIHDFLACLGKHAVEKVSFGFSDLRSVEPEICNIEFVEDTDEVTHYCANGFGLASKEEREAAPGGWGESIQKEENPGWGAEPKCVAKSDAKSSDTGWGMEETRPLDGDGWGNEQVAVQDSGWDSVEKNEVDKAAPLSHQGGWGGKHEAASDNDWETLVKSDANTTAPAAQTETWDSMEGKNPKNGTSKGGFMHPSRRSMNADDSTENAGASERQSGTFAPSGTNMVPLGRRKRFAKADVNTGLTHEEHCEEKDHMDWGASAQSESGDDFGWGGKNREERTCVNATQEGLCQDNWASGMDWEASQSHQPAGKNSKNDSLDKDAWQTVPESEILQETNGWGDDKDSNCKGNSKAPFNPPDSWDAMESQNARKGGKKAAAITDRTEKQNADEWRSGKFATSGSNTIPLGKRRTAMRTNVSNKEPENIMMKCTGPSEVKEDQTGWVNSEQTTAAEGFGWTNSNQEEKETCVKSFEEGLGKEGWGSASNCSASQANQGMGNDSVGKGDWNSQLQGEGSADLHGWGSKVQIIKDVQDDGWGDIKLDSPPVLCSDNRPKPSPRNWDSEGFKSSNAQPQRGSVEQDGTLRPRKKFSRDSSSDSWTAFASRAPQPQSGRPRLRSLMNSPEYAELDGLYRATNKILHHNEYQLGDKLNTEDEKFILEKILVHHRDKEAKVGCGVEYVMIDSHAEHQVSCFWVVRKDGTKTDFSYWKCLEGLYEKKYSQGLTFDGVKDKTDVDWSRGPTAQNDQEGAKASWHIGDNSGAPRKRIWDNENTKGHGDMGVSSAGPPKNIFDEEGTKETWDMGTDSEVPVKGIHHGEAKDSWDMGDSSAVLTKDSCDQGDGWDTCAGLAVLAKNECEPGAAQANWDMGANSAENICDEAARKDLPQEEAKDGWGGF